MPQKKNPKTTPPTGPTSDSERETRVLLEDVRSELKVVAEGHGAIIGRLDKVEEGLQEVKDTTDRLYMISMAGIGIGVAGIVIAVFAISRKGEKI